MQKFSFMFSFLAKLCVVSALCLMTTHAFAKDTSASVKQNVVFEDEAGRQHSLEDYKGYNVIIISWASWCPVCVKEMVELNTAYEELLQRNAFKQNNLVILPISLDSSSDAVAAFRQRHNMTNIPLFIDKPKNTARAFDFSRIPFGIVLDPSGKVIAKLGASEGKSLISSLMDAVTK